MKAGQAFRESYRRGEALDRDHRARTFRPVRGGVFAVARAKDGVACLVFHMGPSTES